MNILKLSILSLLAFSLSLNADMQPGKIKVFQAKGDVSYVNHSTGDSGALTRGMDIEQNYTIMTGLESKALIIFSNGSRMNIAEETKMTITRYVQEPYDSRIGHFLTLKEDPSRSDTLVTLRAGTVVGKVQKLRPESLYDVETAIGSAGIRGTVYLVSFYKTENGLYEMKVGNIEGTVELTTKMPANVVVDDQNQARTDYDPTATLSTGSVPEKTIVIVTALPQDVEDPVDDAIGTEVVFLDTNFEPVIIPQVLADFIANTIDEGNNSDVGPGTFSAAAP